MKIAKTARPRMRPPLPFSKEKAESSLSVISVPETSANYFEAEALGKRLSVTLIGRIEGSSGEARVLGPDGNALKLGAKGFAHF